VSIIDQIAFDQIADERDKAQQENKLLKQRIKRLEEAVETSIRAMEFYGPTSNIANSCKLLKLEMIKAKEAEP
jgi:cell division septum initiation protein DivIVA